MAKKDENKEELKSKLDQAIKKFESTYGKGSIISGNNSTYDLEVISSGSLLINIATNIGGIPVGKLIEILGMESCGKSTFTLMIIAEFQKAGKKCVLIDYEQSFDKEYAKTLEVIVEDLIIVQPNCQEDGYNMAQALIETGEVGLIVIDSHTAALPKKIVDGDVGENALGLQAKINSTALGKIKPLLRDNKCTMIAISQIRQQIGAYGDPNQSTGGLGYKFYSDMRFKFSKTVEKEKDQNKTTIEIIKSKCGNPFGKAVCNILWGIGIDKVQEYIDCAVELGLLEKKAAGWYVISEDSKVQGDEALKVFLGDNPGYYEDLQKKVLDKLGIK